MTSGICATAHAMTSIPFDLDLLKTLAFNMTLTFISNCLHMPFFSLQVVIKEAVITLIGLALHKSSSINAHIFIQFFLRPSFFGIILKM